MTNPLEQLNLRPQEKRVLVAVLVAIFIVLNFWFVTPLFGQWGKAKIELKTAQDKLAKYEAEVARAPSYEKLEQQLKKGGGDVLSEELQLQRIVDNQARAAGVLVSRYAPGVRTSSGRTNQFFEDQGLTIDFNTGGKELVEFLVGLASGNSMIHVQDMNLRPDGTGTKLMGNILFVASYQKKQPTVRPASGSQPKAVVTTLPKTTPPAPAPTSKPKTNAPVAGSSANRPGTNKVKTIIAGKPVTNNVRTASTNSAKPLKK